MYAFNSYNYKFSFQSLSDWKYPGIVDNVMVTLEMTKK